MESFPPVTTRAPARSTPRHVTVRPCPSSRTSCIAGNPYSARAASRSSRSAACSASAASAAAPPPVCGGGSGWGWGRAAAAEAGCGSAGRGFFLFFFRRPSPAASAAAPFAGFSLSLSFPGLRRGSIPAPDPPLPVAEAVGFAGGHAPGVRPCPPPCGPHRPRAPGPGRAAAGPRVPLEPALAAAVAVAARREF